HPADEKQPYALVFDGAGYPRIKVPPGAEREAPMGKFDGLLLASDFDDTLYDLTFHIPERNLEAIRYFTHHGGLFTVSTGRAHRTFAPYAPMVPMNAPAVLSNGAAIYDFQRDRLVEQTSLYQRAPEDL